MRAGWLRVVITPAIRGGVLAVTTATPTVTALFAAASCGRSIVLQLKNPGAGPAGFQHSRILAGESSRLAFPRLCPTCRSEALLFLRVSGDGR
jgi:hypothetical protein